MQMLYKARETFQTELFPLKETLANAWLINDFAILPT